VRFRARTGRFCCVVSSGVAMRGHGAVRAVLQLTKNPWGGADYCRRAKPRGCVAFGPVPACAGTSNPSGRVQIVRSSLEGAAVNREDLAGRPGWRRGDCALDGFAEGVGRDGPASFATLLSEHEYAARSRDWGWVRCSPEREDALSLTIVAAPRLVADPALWGPDWRGEEDHGPWDRRLLGPPGSRCGR